MWCKCAIANVWELQKGALKRLRHFLHDSPTNVRVRGSFMVLTASKLIHDIEQLSYLVNQRVPTPLKGILQSHIQGLNTSLGSLGHVYFEEATVGVERERNSLVHIIGQRETFAPIVEWYNTRIYSPLTPRLPPGTGAVNPNLDATLASSMYMARDPVRNAVCPFLSVRAMHY